MGKIKELRLKVAEGTASDEEVAELEELEAEAKEETDENEEVVDEKSLAGLGKKLANLALADIKAELAKDSKKSFDGNTDKTNDNKPKGIERVGKFFENLLSKNYDVIKLDHLSEGVAADGGFLVPEEYHSTFVESRQDQVVMRRAGATVIQVMSDTYNIPQLSTRPKAYWRAELAVKSSTSASWTNLSLTPYSLAAIMTASNEVVEDAKIGGNLIQVMTRLMTEAIATAEDAAFFMGSGTGQPTGLTTYTPGATIAAGGALDADDVVNLLYSLPQGYRNRAVWFMNQRALRAVRMLKDSQGRPLFENALTGTDFPTLLGRPIFEQNDMASSVIWLGDPAMYWIGDRSGISVRVTDEATVGGQSAFERNFTAIRVEERVDGELVDTRAFASITGTGVA